MAAAADRAFSMTCSIRAAIRAAILLAAASLPLTGAEAQQKRGQKSPPLSVTFLNKSEAKLLHLHVTPSDEVTWGDDLLGDNMIEPGRRNAQTIPRTASCRYDIRAVFDDWSQDVDTDVNLCATRLVTFDGSRAVSVFRLVRLSQRRPVSLFLVRNDTKNEMTTLTTADAAGGEISQLGRIKVGEDESFVGRFRRESGCTIDIAAEFAEGDPQFLPRQDICKVPLVLWKAAEAPVSVKVNNRGSYSVKSIFIRPQGARIWGGDRLGSSSLSERQSKTISVAPTENCLFDIKVVIDEAKDDIRNGVNLCASKLISIEGPELLAGRGAKKGEQAKKDTPKTRTTIEVVNDARRGIKELFVSPAKTSDWGDNILEEPIAPGARTSVGFESSDQCQFDVKAVYVGGKEQKHMNRDLCGEASVTIGGAHQSVVDGGGPAAGLAVSFVNDGKTPVQSLFLTPANDTHWGDDRLGSNMLAQRSRLEVRLPRAAGCQWDIQMKYNGDTVRERRGVDLCANPTQSVRLKEKAGAVLSTGTGFFVSATGHVLTNNHVVEGCAAVAISRDGQRRIPLRVIHRDADVDLALLQADQPDTPFIAISTEDRTPPRAGDRVLTIGFPIRNRLGVINVTEGTISAASGPDGDASRLQHTAPTQSGSSGGPILDMEGLAVGVVVSRLGQGGDDDQQAQNVNFGVSLEALRSFLKDARMDAPAAPAAVTQRPAADIFATASPAVLPLDCIE
jgi:S1-C subfamily serine protease